MPTKHSGDWHGRRTFLTRAGGAAVLGATGLAGCISVNPGDGVTTGATGGLDELTLAYMPIYPDMQYFVMEEEGFLEALPVEVSAEQFSDGPSIVQAYAKGDFEVAMFGIVPAMIVIDKGLPSRITAANIKNAMQILAHESFAETYEAEGARAFARFREEHDRPFTFGTFPPGSVPDILLRYWLETELGLDPTTDVEIVPMGGAGPVRQGLLSGKIDGTSIMEPVPTIVDRADAPYEAIGWAGEFMPGQPAAVTLMHDRLRVDAPELATAFLEQHRRATRFVADHPDRAAAAASSVIGEEVLPVDVARAALDSRASDFTSNPHDIESGAKIFAEYASKLGKTESTLSISELFDHSLYDEVA